MIPITFPSLDFHLGNPNRRKIFGGIKLRLHRYLPLNTKIRSTMLCFNTVADPDSRPSDKRGGGGHPDIEIRRRSPKKFFLALWASFSPKNKGDQALKRSNDDDNDKNRPKKRYFDTSSSVFHPCQEKTKQRGKKSKK